ncbi:MAG: diguanylate cyclase [Ectothiorhodospiraceae bacterium]|nr:diguanylate cyclase [Ectothiorhodospiraceae bacterium]
MTETINCLLLSASSSFTGNAEKWLKSTSYSVESAINPTLATVENLLINGDWDIVLIDFLLSTERQNDFSVDDALSTIIHTPFELPTLIIYPPENLEKTLLLIDKGAVDCIRIDELSRLIPVVRREVARARHYGEMAKLQQRHDMLLNAAAEGFWDWDLTTGEMFFSYRWLEMLGYGKNEFTPSFNSWVDLIHPDDLGLYLELWTDYMDGTAQQFRVEYRMRAKTGDYHWVSARGVSVSHQGDEPVYLAGSLNDITDRKQVEQELQCHRERLEEAIAERTAELRSANEQLSRLARLDGLTEIPNRRCLDETLARECSRVSRDGIPLTLLMIDIDFFKQYNDEFGHQEGDTCLKMVAASIRRSMLRPSDLVARYGGEEFVVLLPNTSREGGLKLYERIRDELAELKGVGKRPTVSVGLATVNAGVQITPERLLASVDKVLYQAKGAGRNCLEECAIVQAEVA